MIARILIALALLTGSAFGQTVVGPQTVNPPNVVSGADSTGTFTQRQVAYTDLSFPALFGLATTASNQVTVATGDQTFYLDYDPGYQLGYTVQVISLIDPIVYMTGRISSYTNSGGQTQITVSVTQEQGDSFTGSSWYLQIVSSDAAFIPVTGVSLSPLTYGTGAGQISQGGVVNLTTETGLLLNNSHVVAVAIGSPTNYFRGISQYNSSTGALTIYTTDSSGSGTFSAWSLFAQDGPPINANQIALSQTPVTMSAADLTFTIQSGQNLPIQGPVTITALSATANQMLGTIKAYSGTSLIVTVPSTGIYGSGNYAAWSILNTGPPQTRISLYQMNGLQIRQDSVTSSKVDINSGSVRDSSDTVDLPYVGGSIDLTSTTSVVRVSGAGTLSSAGANVTGSGSAFLTFFAGASDNPGLTDFNNQLTAIGQGTIAYPVIISTAAQATIVLNITNNTSLTTGGDPVLGAGAGTTYFRGGIVNTSNTSLVAYGIVVARKDSDGTVAAFATSVTRSGSPDLPSGYTYYRVIGMVGINYNGSSYTVQVSQPLVSNPLNKNGDIFYFDTSSGVFPLFNARLAIGAQYKTVQSNGSDPAYDAVHLDQSAAVTGQLPITNVNISTALSQLTANVALNNTANYFTGPQMAQGNSGTWWVSGDVNINDTAGTAAIECKLWDGIGPVYDSGRVQIAAANGRQRMHLGAIMSALSGNIRISCKDITSTSGQILFNDSGNGVDSSIWGIRIQ